MASVVVGRRGYDDEVDLGSAGERFTALECAGNAELGRDGTLVLTGETTLEVGRPGGALEDASVPDDLWEQTVPNNMWARSFVRLMRDLVAVLDGRRAAGEPATFYDGLAVQRVMDAVRDGRGARLD